jgi:hypothetical protein
MFKEDLLGTLKRVLEANGTDSETAQAISKLQSEQKLSSKEFLQIYDALRKEGPHTRYQHPENWTR